MFPSIHLRSTKSGGHIHSPQNQCKPVEKQTKNTHKTNDFSLIETIKTEVKNRKLQNYRITPTHIHVFYHYY